MESVKIKEFLSIETNYGHGYGYGSGHGYIPGYGYGYGCSSGSGYNSGCGSGFGSGAGYGFGYGCSYGYGYGSGLGPGNCSGSGSGDGGYFGFGIKTFRGDPVYIIDDIPTIIRSIRGNIAKCMILNVDLTTTPCFVVKIGNCFAHGKTIKETFLVAQAKHFNEMQEDERLQAFVDAHKWGVEYPDKDFYDWHNKLTGSCKMGRDRFAQEHGLEKLDGKHTIEWFVNLTKDSYGGEIIKRIPSLYKSKECKESA